MEALEARVHLSNSAFKTGLVFSIQNRHTGDWTNYAGDEITIPESQYANVMLHAYTYGSAGHNYHFKFTATHDGKDASPFLPPNELEGDARIDDHDMAPFGGMWGYMNDDGDWVMRWEVVQDDGATASDTFTIHVLNEPPHIGVYSSSSTIKAGMPLGTAIGPAWDESIQGTVSWESRGDQMAGVTYRIDWDGDGTVDETAVYHPAAWNPYDGFFREHTFTYGGDYTISVTGEDKDGAVSAPAYCTVHVDGPPRPVDPQPSPPPSPEPEPSPAPEVQRATLTPTVTTNPFHATTTTVQDDSLFADSRPILA